MFLETPLYSRSPPPQLDPTILREVTRIKRGKRKKRGEGGERGVDKEQASEGRVQREGGVVVRGRFWPVGKTTAGLHR